MKPEAGSSTWTPLPHRGKSARSSWAPAPPPPPGPGPRSPNGQTAPAHHRGRAAVALGGTRANRQRRRSSGLAQQAARIYPGAKPRGQTSCTSLADTSKRPGKGPSAEEAAAAAAWQGSPQRTTRARRAPAPRKACRGAPRAFPQRRGGGPWPLGEGPRLYLALVPCPGASCPFPTKGAVDGIGVRGGAPLCCTHSLLNRRWERLQPPTSLVVQKGILHVDPEGCGGEERDGGSGVAEEGNLGRSWRA